MGKEKAQSKKLPTIQSELGGEEELSSLLPCLKRSFSSQAEALEEINIQRVQYNLNFRAYKHWCGKWHLTSKLSEKKLKNLLYFDK